MAIAAAKITQSLKEKRYNTLNIIESAFMQGSEVNIFPVTEQSMSELGAERFVNDMENPLNTYVIFDERPKPQLLQRYGWYRENSDNVPILAYIPTHLLYQKSLVGNGDLTLEYGEYILPFDNTYDSTIITSHSRLLRKVDGEYVDISNTISLSSGESIKKLISSKVGVIILSTSGRMFSWGRINDDGWSTPFILRNMNMVTIDNTPTEISSRSYNDFGYNTGEKIKDIFSIGTYTGAIALMESGKIYVWGHNHQGKLFKPSTSYYDYIAEPSDRTSSFLLMAGETVIDIKMIGFSTVAVTDKGRFIYASGMTIAPVTTWFAGLESGEEFTNITGSYYSTYLKTNKGRYFNVYNPSIAPINITNYFGSLLEDDEEIISFKSPADRSHTRRAIVNYQAPLYIITNKGRLFSNDIIFNTSTIISSYASPTLVTTLPMSIEHNEKPVDISFNMEAYEGEYIIYIYTNLGRVLKYEVLNASVSSDELEVYAESVINSVSLDGDDMLSIAENGESDNYKLKEISITRGAIIDIKYDFLTDRDLNDRISRFYVADVKVDLVSLNYVANLVPYKYVEPDKGNEKTDFKKINYSSDDSII